MDEPGFYEKTLPTSSAPTPVGLAPHAAGLGFASPHFLAAYAGAAGAHRQECCFVLWSLLSETLEAHTHIVLRLSDGPL